MQATKARHQRIFKAKFLLRELEKNEFLYKTFGMKQKKIN